MRSALLRSRGLLPGLASSGASRLRSAMATPKLRLEPQLEAVLSRFRASTKGDGRPKEEVSSRLVEEFERLQSRKVQRVLLVCSDYDSYTFEQDGLLTELVDEEYAESGLTKPPTIERVSTPEAALARVRADPTNFDMIITLLRSEGRTMNTGEFVSSVQQVNPALPIGLLALSPSELTAIDSRIDRNLRINVNKRLMWETGDAALKAGTAAVDSRAGSSARVADAWVWPFVWQGNVSLFTAMFKAVEDRLNAANDSEYGVQSILLVEDNVKFYSSYLPTLYLELWKQNQSLRGETMTLRERMLRMKSRPKVLLCTNFEEAADIYSRYSDNIIGLITDAGFPRDGEHDPFAGVSFAEHVLSDRPALPVLVQSAAPPDSEIAQAAAPPPPPRPCLGCAAAVARLSLGCTAAAVVAQAARRVGAKFTSKNQPSLLSEIRHFLTEDMMFGPLTFQDGLTGSELGSVSSVTELLSTWQSLPESAVAFHARECHLSKWFLARAEFSLARRFRASNYPTDFIDPEGRERADWLRNWILSETRAHRNKLASGVENVHSADASTTIVRLGKGSLGGKGRGFRFLHSIEDKYSLSTLLPELEMVVPRSFILATEVFDRFIEDNKLMVPALNATTNEEVREMFAAATLPQDVTVELRRYLEAQTSPLAVRSSSLFEDAFLQPFAGIYESIMLPNTAGSLEARLDELSWAVRMVYASAYCLEARAYSEGTGNRAEEEKMAVIMQEVVGDVHGDHFYPSLAGVANSIDFYPRPHTQPEDGCAQLRLGLGFGVVDNLPSVHLSLGDPANPTGYAEGEMQVSALNLAARPGAAAGEDSLLVSLPAESGAAAAALTTVPRLSAGSVVAAPEAASSVPLSHDVHGERVVFKQGYGEERRGEAPPPPDESAVVLPLQRALSGEVPLASALAFLLRLGSAGLGCPVEIEFALRLRKDAGSRHQLHVLQMRPQADLSSNNTARALRFRYLPTSDYAAMASKHALGHGRFEQIRDVVFVPPGRFSPENTTAIAAEISAINAQLRAEGRKCLLIAPGRWGSADTARGIPVGWADIDASTFIVETTVPGSAKVPLSQGSHFFQNLLSFGHGYATVEEGSDEYADYDYWERLPAEAGSGEFARHVRLPEPLEVVVDGMSRRGVVMKPGKPFEVYIAQVDAFMAIQEQASGSM